MTYIILAAGAGTRLHPITLRHPKTLFKLDEKTTVLGRWINLLSDLDGKAEIVVVTGFQRKLIEEHISNAILIHNPFYEVTNSIASLWFAREFMDRDVTIINGDVVMSRALIEDVLIHPVTEPSVLMDSSILKDGDYNIQASAGKVIVMSKDLSSYSGEYAGVTKLDRDSARLVRYKMEEMIDYGMYTTWYESAMVQMIFEENFQLSALDISQYAWTEVDSVDDLLLAKSIHQKECNEKKNKT